MATYKVLQDIEAEDKLLGPLTLRQFIYAGIVIVFGFIIFSLVRVKLWFLCIPLIPPTIFFTLLAAPFGKDQSSEVWLLAKIRFVVFPRKRIWSQSGVLDLVTITVPKKVDKHLTKDFDKEEAKSRLKALASTMDTHGWAIKNVGTNLYANPLQNEDSDRLLSLQTVPRDDLTAVKPSEDVLNPSTNPLNEQLGYMVAESEQAHRQELLQKMQTIAGEQQATTASTETRAILNSANRPIKPVATAQRTPPTTLAPAKQTTPPMTQPQAPDIINSVDKNAASELDVQHASTVDTSSDEVVVSLH